MCVLKGLVGDATQSGSTVGLEHLQKRARTPKHTDRGILQNAAISFSAE